MPTYEYACRDCDEDLEVIQSFEDDPLTECPACGGELRKVFSTAGIILKGGGWHVKDYSTGTRTKSPNEVRGKVDPSKSESGDASGGSDDASSGSSDDGDSGTERATA